MHLLPDQPGAMLARLGREHEGSAIHLGGFFAAHLGEEGESEARGRVVGVSPDHGVEHVGVGVGEEGEEEASMAEV